MKSLKVILVIGFVVLSISPGLCQYPLALGQATVISPANHAEFESLPNQTITISLSTTHWIVISGATPNTSYGINWSASIAINSVMITGSTNYQALITDGDGNKTGSTLPLSGTADRYAGSYNASAFTTPNSATPSIPRASGYANNTFLIK